MLEVSHDAVAVGEEQLASCAAEQSKYCSICTVTLDPCGVTSRGHNLGHRRPIGSYSQKPNGLDASLSLHVNSDFGHRFDLNGRNKLQKLLNF
jgi:hypothetical protein